MAAAGGNGSVSVISMPDLRSEEFFFGRSATRAVTVSERMCLILGLVKQREREHDQEKQRNACRSHDQEPRPSERRVKDVEFSPIPTSRTLLSEGPVAVDC